MSDLKDRILRAAKLDAAIYEEVEADQEALGQATGVVVLSSVAAGVGSGIQSGPGGVVVGIVGALIAWYVWAYLTYVVGTKLLPEPQKPVHKVYNYIPRLRPAINQVCFP